MTTLCAMATPRAASSGDLCDQSARPTEPCRLSRGSALAAQGDVGNLGIAVPKAFGGEGGKFTELFRFVCDLAQRSIFEATTYAVQRHFIEVLLSASNAALCEYRLPRVIEGRVSGACSATWRPWRKAGPPVTVRSTGRSWKIEGHVPAIPNIDNDWFLVGVPLQRSPGESIAVALLSSEQEGITRFPKELAGFEGSCRAGVVVSNFHLAESEIIDEDGELLSQAMGGVTMALRCALAAGLARSAISCISDLSLRNDKNDQLGAAINRLDEILESRRALVSVSWRSSEILEQFSRVAWEAVQAGDPDEEGSQRRRMIYRGLSQI